MPTVPTTLGPIFVDDQGGADQAVVLLWPSLFNDYSMWRFQLPVLRAAGWRTLALDPPGQGRSDGLERPFTMDECAAAALQTLDALNVQSPVVVVGSSWGGMVAPRIALRAPDRVRGLVLFNTTADEASAFDRVKNSLLVKMLTIGPLDRLVNYLIVSVNFAAETRRAKPELERELIENFRRWNRRKLTTTVQSVLVDRDSSLDALPGVKCPSLIVSGKEDSVLPSSHSLRIAARLPKARHVEVPAAAHLVPLEAPEASNALILDFLAHLPSLGAAGAASGRVVSPPA